MSKSPKWLHEFPFVQSQWDHITAISDIFADLDCYDLDLDWQRFVRVNPHLDIFALLRQFRKSRLAYIAYQDFNQPIQQHLKAMHLVSDLADHLIAYAYQRVNDEMVEKFGWVKSDQGQTIGLNVFALGKLGTCELNYSSDVDLVFVYDGAGNSDGPRSLSAETYFTRMGQKLIKLLDHFTTDGQVYRVDMRLRPFGSAGPLVCSSGSLSQYLVNEGRDWERFAWMRGRLVCGDPICAQPIIDEINAFIYRKHLDYSVFTSLAKIKNEIALTHDNNEDDLKQGPGGIRVIEFIVQSLQLVFGGRLRKLQGQSIYPQFTHLLAANKLPESDEKLLRSTWLWLRKLENLSQSVNDQAIHHVPINKELNQYMANLFGFQSWQSLQEKLHDDCQGVDKIFVQLFQHSSEPSQLTQSHKDLLKSLLATLNLRKVHRETSKKVHQLLECTVIKAPAQVARDFTDIVKVLIRRPNYLLMLLKEQNVHNNVLSLINTHSYFKQVLTQYPVLFEQLFDSQQFQQLNHQLLASQWQVRLAESIAVKDEEAWMEQLRYFKLIHQFNLMRTVSGGEFTEKQMSQQLTVLAEFILAEVVGYSFDEISKKFSDIKLSSSELMVLAYGSMAVYDMSVNSDLDLVFVVDKDFLTADERYFIQRWTKRILHHLSSPMYHGILYEIDLQLRPNGNSGALVTTKKEFEKYQREQAWTWEHAAMVKSRMVLGSNEQKQWHQSFRKSILTQKRNLEQVDQDLLEMSIKLQAVKKNKAHEQGFAVLGAVLKYSHQYPDLVAELDMKQLVVQLKSLNLIE